MNGTTVKIITAWFAVFSNSNGNPNTNILYGVFYFYINIGTATCYSGITVGGN